MWRLRDCESDRVMQHGGIVKDDVFLLVVYVGQYHFDDKPCVVALIYFLDKL